MSAFAEGYEFERAPVLRPEDTASYRRALEQPTTPTQLPPYTKEELDEVNALLRMDPRSRIGAADPYRCAHREPPSRILQCRNRLADPTLSRYCTEHREDVGEALAPDDYLSTVADEARANLVRLVPKALTTAESVMDDGNAPAGVRLKAATEILDRTGYRAGVDLVVKGEVQVVDMTSIIAARLDAMGDSMRRLNAENVIDVESVESPEPAALQQEVPDVDGLDQRP